MLNLRNHIGNRRNNMERFSNLFGNSSMTSSDPFAARLDALRSAEEKLLTYARQFIPSQFELPADDDFDITSVDTKISKLRIFGDASSGNTGNNDSSSCCVVKKSDVTCQVNSTNEEDGHYILHSVKVSHKKSDCDESVKNSSPLVLQHGYANAAMYFYRNLFGLSRQHYKEIHTLDMLGWGLSSRPHFLVSSKSDDRTTKIRNAEKFFVESLEAWREANGIEKMTLAGHSMGGYLSVAYCEKYPHRVDNLILISPVGVPQVDEEEEKQKWSKLPYKYQFLFGTFRLLWKSGITPGGFMRSLSESRGRKMVEGYVNGRLPALEDVEEKFALSDYLYTNSILPGSGEYVLNYVLKPGAHAREALVQRIPKLKVPRISFLYGKHDWMDISGGLEVQKICEDITTEGGEAPSIDVYEVDRAGHLLMLENWHEFNTGMILSGGGKAYETDPKPSSVHHSSYVKAPRRF